MARADRIRAGIAALAVTEVPNPAAKDTIGGATVTTLPVWPSDVAVHPAAELFPLISGADFAELVDDIRTNGLAHPIVRTPDGQILDGRNRYRACLDAGITPSYQEHDGEPWQYVISTNLRRRHLTDGQRAMIAAKIAERTAGRPKMVAGETISSEAIPTRAQAAQMLNVSPGQLARARVVEKHGTEALKTAVESGAVPVATAARVATVLPVSEQDAFAEKVIGGADPRKVAPPDDRSSPPPSTSTAGGAGGRTRYQRSETVSRRGVEKLVAMVGGLVIGLSDARAVDESITDAEAVRWGGELSEGIRSLRKLTALLKERHQ